MKGLKKIIIASMVGLLAFTSAGGVLLTTNTSVTEAATKKNGWYNGYFYVNGKKATGYYNNYYLVNGKKANGFHNTSGSNWVLFKNGLRCYVSGLIKNENNGKWYAVYNGIVKWNYNGLLSNEYGMWQMKNGTIDFSFTGTYSLKLYDTNKGKQVVEKVKVVNGKVQKPSNLLRITFNVGCCPAG